MEMSHYLLGCVDGRLLSCSHTLHDLNTSELVKLYLESCWRDWPTDTLALWPFQICAQRSSSWRNYLSSYKCPLLSTDKWGRHQTYWERPTSCSDCHQHTWLNQVTPWRPSTGACVCCWGQQFIKEKGETYQWSVFYSNSQKIHTVKKPPLGYWQQTLSTL